MRIGESRHSRAHVDWVLIILVFALSAFGVLAVTVATFSTTSVADDNLLNNIVSSYYGQRQGIFFFVSMVAIGVMLAIPYELIRRYSMLIYIGACGLLGVALGIVVLVVGYESERVLGVPVHRHLGCLQEWSFGFSGEECHGTGDVQEGFNGCYPLFESAQSWALKP